MSTTGQPRAERAADEVERLSLAASLQSAAANAATGWVAGPVIVLLVLRTGGVSMQFAGLIAVAISVVTVAVGLLCRRAAAMPTYGELQGQMPAVYLLSAVLGILYGATSLAPLEPLGLDNPMYAVLIATGMAVIATNMPLGFARTSLFAATAGPVVVLYGSSLLMNAGAIGIALAMGPCGHCCAGRIQRPLGRQGIPCRV